MKNLANDFLKHFIKQGIRVYENIDTPIAEFSPNYIEGIIEHRDLPVLDASSRIILEPNLNEEWIKIKKNNVATQLEEISTRSCLYFVRREKR